MLNSNYVILNGSPNKKGHTMQCALMAFEETNPLIIHTYDLNVTSCDDCKLCQHKPRCKHSDDVDTVIDAIEACETLIIASPVYFGAMTDRLLKIINRFQMVFERKFTHKLPVPTVKNLILVSTAASSEPTMFDGVKLTISILAQLFSATQVHHLLVGDTDHETMALSNKKTAVAKFKATLEKEAILE